MHWHPYKPRTAAQMTPLNTALCSFEQTVFRGTKFPLAQKLAIARVLGQLEKLHWGRVVPAETDEALLQALSNLKGLYCADFALEGTHVLAVLKSWHTTYQKFPAKPYPVRRQNERNQPHAPTF